MNESSTIFVVDDDAAVRDSLRLLLSSAGYRVELFDSARQFLNEEPASRRGCLLADIRMPGMDGLELQEEIARRNAAIPVIIMTGHGDVPHAVRAMKAGAIDFLEKPFNRGQLLASIKVALDRGTDASQTSADAAKARAGLAELTERERDVFDLLVAGHQNKMIGHKLDISPRTVQVHRGRIMHKMQVQSLQELVRLALALREK